MSVHSLDTKVLVRFPVRNDEVQPRATVELLARGVAAGGRFFFGAVVLAETRWVLSSRQRCIRGELAAVVRQPVGAEEPAFESADRVVRALHAFEHGAAGFADQLIGEAARDAGCPMAHPFDQKTLPVGVFVHHRAAWLGPSSHGLRHQNARTPSRKLSWRAQS